MNKYTDTVGAKGGAMGSYKIFELDGNMSEEYAGFTYSPYRLKLKNAGMNGNIIAVGAEVMGSPAGLALAEKNINGCISIISVNVEESLRSKGIGSELISKAEEISSRKGISKIVAEYAGGKPHTPVIEHILKKRQWTDPTTKSIVYRCSSKGRRPEEIPWWMSYKMDRLPDGIFPWQEITDIDRHALKNSVWIPQGLSPFINQEMIDSKYSFGVRVKGEIVGWIIYHRIRKDTTVCRSLFVREDMRDKGFAPIMVIKSLQLQYGDDIENFMFTIHNNNEYVLPMIRRWMGRYIVSAVEWHESYKQL